ncbi:hypothetical protein FQA47_018115 [Oryzias melastigma]|uniref:Uncharacterized protein n=1 Tax=Oryzias melastigma TaxID=30732 RepID=A0A834CGZ6_ORYME|nr:hypothetical protein FQA47_018115 [Oryzias melastigma]
MRMLPPMRTQSTISHAHQRRSIQSSSLEAGLSSEKALKLPCRWQALFVKETSSVWHRNCKRHQQVCEAPNVT